VHRKPSGRLPPFFCPFSKPGERGETGFDTTWNGFEAEPWKLASSS
jgi:hypothetical protein